LRRSSSARDTRYSSDLPYAGNSGDGSPSRFSFSSLRK
jgi:hypothetical protein